jgi:hypothetical protein
MLANFKKLGVAAAVASTLGVSGAAQAVIQGTPGDALLIPHVVANPATGVNTLIGVTVADPQFTDLTDFTTVTPSSKVDPEGPSYCGLKAELHWYFFSINSVHLADGVIPVTCEDFVRIDWNYISTTFYPDTVGVPGYMVITDDLSAVLKTDSGLVLYGSTYLIQGNWASQAYIPVLPLLDKAEGSLNDEVKYDGIIVGEVNPVTAGMKLADKPGEIGWFSLRYFLDPALKGNTRFVLWYPDNNSARNNQAIVVYDADELGRSTQTSFPNELNILCVSPTAQVGDGCTGVIRGGGLENTSPDGEGVTAVGKAVNTGYVLFNVADCTAKAIGDGNCKAVNGPNDDPSSGRAGFAFSLIGIGSDANPLQVQTEVAYERGVTGE